MPRGTVVKASCLFGKLPVRREMFSSEKRRRDELRKVEEVMLALSVAHVEVGFTLAHNKHVVWRKPRAQDVLNAFGVGLGDVAAMKQLVKFCRSDDKVSFHTENKKTKFFFNVFSCIERKSLSNCLKTTCSYLCCFGHGLRMGHWWISAVRANLSIPKPIFSDLLICNLEFRIWSSE
jgi:hypothetical protein